jgi:hypothetical protein
MPRAAESSNQVPPGENGDAPFILSVVVSYLHKAALSGLVLDAWSSGQLFLGWGQLPFLEVVVPGSGNLYLRDPHFRPPFSMILAFFVKDKMDVTVMFICRSFVLLVQMFGFFVVAVVFSNAYCFCYFQSLVLFKVRFCDT